MDISDSRNRNLIIINHENWIQKKKQYIIAKVGQIDTNIDKN